MIGRVLAERSAGSRRMEDRRNMGSRRKNEK